MREILFRGKREDGEWVYGFYYKRVIPPFWFSEEYELKDAIEVYDGESMDSIRYYDVIPETVGQYTGLTDKNGKRIFEGDIVSTDIERPYLVVEFRDGCFMFNCNDGGEDYYDIMLPILKEPQTIYEYGEVIGNIHDNPEPPKE